MTTEAHSSQHIVRLDQSTMNRILRLLDCTGKHPANRILSNFYLPKAHEGARLPKILGLSASPVMKAKASTEALE